MDFKLENVLVSLHSLKTMGFGPVGSSASLFLRNGELLGHSPIQNKAALLNYRLETFLIRMMMRVMLLTVNS